LREAELTLPPSTIITDLCAPEIYEGVTFPMWTLYAYPTDFPDNLVMRLFEGMNAQPTDKVFLAKTLEEVYEAVPPWMVRLNRDPGDDPKILGVFV
jgi:hypothetical protein